LFLNRDCFEEKNRLRGDFLPQDDAEPEKITLPHLIYWQSAWKRVRMLPIKSQKATIKRGMR